jgi:hypothetical protein
MKAMDKLQLNSADRRKIYFGNAVNLLRLELPKRGAERRK